MLHEICMAEHNCKTLSKQCCSAMQPPERQGPVLPSHLEGALMVLRGGPQSVHDGSPNVRKDTYTVVRRLSAATWASTSMRPWLPGTPPELLGGSSGELGFQHHCNPKHRHDAETCVLPLFICYNITFCTFQRTLLRLQICTSALLQQLFSSPARPLLK